VLILIPADYDDGAADALMVLHGDRPPSNGAHTSAARSTVGLPSTSQSPTSSTTIGSTGQKRADPPSPITPNTAKRSRADNMSSTSSPSLAKASSAEKRMVIEVLNVPKIGSPLPQPSNSDSNNGSKEGSNSVDEGSGTCVF
jgi:glucose repression mediator protein